MNIGILKKVLDELESATPRIEYVRGMLEALYAMHADHPPVVVASGKLVDTTNQLFKGSAPVINAIKDDEAVAMEAMGAKGAAIMQELKNRGQLQ